MMKEHLKKNAKKILIIILICAILAFATSMLEIYNNSFELVQFMPITNSQMMGYSIITKNKAVILIDGGTKIDGEQVRSYLESYGRRVDYWFLTHPHKDHVGAFINIVENTDIQIGKVFVSLNTKEWYEENGEGRTEEAVKLMEVLQNDKIKDRVEEVSLNQEMNIDNVKVEILGVKNPEITNNAINNSSMVAKFKVNNKGVLFLGDSGKESGEKLLSTQKDKIKSEVVQMAHHGQDGVSKEVYQAIEPQKCFWPTPKWLWDNDNGGGENSGDWKTLETRKWIEELQIKENYVAKDGIKRLRIW